jgi:hypothetical protein
MRVANREDQVNIVAETSQLCPTMLSVADTVDSVQGADASS